MTKLTSKELLKAKKRINNLKRHGWTLNPSTIVMKINDREINYRTFKKLLKTIK